MPMRLVIALLAGMNTVVVAQAVEDRGAIFIRRGTDTLVVDPRRYGDAKDARFQLFMKKLDTQATTVKNSEMLKAGAQYGL